MNNENDEGEMEQTIWRVHAAYIMAQRPHVPQIRIMPVHIPGEVCTSSSPATVSYSMYCTLRTHLGPSETQKLIPCATSVSQVDKKSCTALPEHHCRLIDTEWGTYARTARTARIRGPWRCVILANLRASHVSDKNFVHYSCCMYYSTFL